MVTGTSSVSGHYSCCNKILWLGAGRGFQRQTFLSCGSGSWGSKIQVPADSGSRFIVGAFSLGLYTLEGTPLPLTPNMLMYDS